MRVDTALISTLLAPTAALAVALGPAVAMPPATAPAVPLVQAQAIQLAGIGQDIYNAITPAVQYVVGGVSYLVNFIPVVGGIVAAQINIDYFQGIQPAVAATVNYAAAVLRDPLEFFPITRAYVDSLVGIGYGLVSAQLRFLGFNELPPRPAASRTAAPRAAASASAAPGHTAGTPAPAVVAEQTAVPVTVAVPVTAPARTARAARVRDARSQERPQLRPSTGVTAAAAEKGSRSKPERQARAAASKRAGAAN